MNNCFQDRYRKLKSLLKGIPKETIRLGEDFFNKIISYYSLTCNTRILLVGYANDVKYVYNRMIKKGIDAEMRIFMPEEIECDVANNMIRQDDIVRLSCLEIDTLIICSYGCRFLINMLLISNGAKYKIVDLYDSFEILFGKRLTINIGEADAILKNTLRNTENELKNIVNRLVYNNKTMICNNYDAIFCHIHAYNNSKKENEKEYYLRLIIEELYYIKDIINLKYYIEIYCERKYFYYRSYKRFIQRLDNLLKDIKVGINKNEGIVIFWTDAVSQSMSDCCDLFSKIKKSSIEFKNVYTHIPYTDGTIHSILTGFPYMEDKVDYIDGRFVSISISTGKAKLVNILQKENYHLLEVGANYIDLFYPNIRSLVQTSVTVKYKYRPSTIHLWDAICELAQGINNKKVIFIHCDCESHHPYWSHSLSKMGIGRFIDIKGLDDIELKEQKIEALKYLEEQIIWYNSFISDFHYNKIFMSDHGTAYPGYLEDRIKPYCIVSGKKIKPSKEKRLFSYLNFYKLIKWLITEEKYDDLFSDQIYIQNENPYGETFINMLKNNYFLMKDNFVKDYSLWAGFRGILNSKYKAILLRNGDFKVFLIPSEKEIQDDGVKTRLLPMVGDTFEDLNLSKYYYSREFVAECEKRGIKI